MVRVVWNGEYLDDASSALYVDYKAAAFNDKGIGDLFNFLVENNCENKTEDVLLVVFEINLVTSAA